MENRIKLLLGVALPMHKTNIHCKAGTDSYMQKVWGFGWPLIKLLIM